VQSSVQVWRDGTGGVPADAGRTVVTIGVFDGVHRGHQRIAHRALARAAELRLPAVAVTFDPLPESVIRPLDKPALLTTLPRRLDLLGELGIDAAYVIDFTTELSRRSPEDFVQSVLVEKLRAVDIAVGANFRFGRRAAGDVAMLAELGLTAGFMVDPIQLAGPISEPDSDASSKVFSSSWIRERIAAGDVEGAADALGRPHRLEATVIHGDHRGRELGYPTANLDVVADLAVPADGVYAGRLDGMPAAISIGTNSTFGGTGRRVEAYAIDEVGLELYGAAVTLDFVSRVRPMVTFDSVDALVAQIAQDVEESRKRLADSYR
jgi:riboflavin kinase/FMN adenylyltransferase